ncbi:MAG: hypothetical protein U9R19_16475, partial [Bacteroidota bacterium]|nr:hypothetical protein [Bacteroidota bacterium]
EMNMSREEKKRYESYLINLARERGMFATAKEDGLVEGEKIGMKKGKVDERYIIAKKMRDKGKPIDEIIEFTGLSKEEIEDL